MNISEVKSLVEGASYEDKLSVLEDIFLRVGDCQEIGYLGSSVSNISLDDFSRLEFQSEKVIKTWTVKSTGVVLDDCVFIMQIQERNNDRLLRLYSWKLDGNKYTYLTFDSLLALEKAYYESKKQNVGFLAENIDGYLQIIGLSYRDIIDVSVAIKTPEKLNNYNVELVDFEKLLTSFGI